jgi:hypothetical protein
MACPERSRDADERKLTTDNNPFAFRPERSSKKPSKNLSWRGKHGILERFLHLSNVRLDRLDGLRVSFHEGLGICLSTVCRLTPGLRKKTVFEWELHNQEDNPYG